MFTRQEIICMALATCRATPRDRSPRSANLSIIASTFFSIADLLSARLRIYIDNIRLELKKSGSTIKVSTTD